MHVQIGFVFAMQMDGVIDGTTPMSLRIAIAVLVLAVAECSSASIAAEDETDGAFNPDMTVVLPVATNKKLKGWTPTAADIQAFEAALLVRMKNPGEDDFIPTRLPKPHYFYRQYMGYVENGKHKILVNAFTGGFGLPAQYKTRDCLLNAAGGDNVKLGPCPADPNDPRDRWKFERIKFYDGGCSMFVARFDAATQKIESLFCNGTA